MNHSQDYNGPVEIAKGIYWIGHFDANVGLQCNPYLIVEGDEAIVIDGGSRSDFSFVMLKILQTGINPNNINRLIYQHYDPDLCGSIPHFESMIHNEDLKIMSHHENNIFIKYYSTVKPKLCIEELGFSYTFKTGRRLKFIRTPYAHSAGSFMTYDENTRTLFTSDLFGSYDHIWELYIDLKNQCGYCEIHDTCPEDSSPCALNGIRSFHRRVMPSTAALEYALNLIKEINPILIAPQHGSVIRGEAWIGFVLKQLDQVKQVGIEWFLEEGD